MPRTLQRLILAFTLVFLALLAVDAYPGLRGGAGWRWPYAPPESWVGVAALAILLAAYLALMGWLARSDARPRPFPVLLVIVLAGAAAGIGATAVRGDPAFLLFTRTVSPVQTGASAVAVRVMSDSGAVDPTQAALERWPDIMREAYDLNLIHFTTSPPGQALFHDALAETIDRHAHAAAGPPSRALRPFQCSEAPVMAYTRGELLSAGAGALMPLWAVLAAIPLYAAALLLDPQPGDTATRRRRALLVAAWWPLVPSIALFAPTWSTLYPALCVAAFALLLAGLRSERAGVFAGLSFAAGAVMSVATFLNFAVLPALFLFGLFTLGVTDLRRAVAAGLSFGLGLSIAWVAFYAAAGWTPFDLLLTGLDAHSDLVQRDPLPWLLLHPYDTLMFAGWPLAALFAWGLWRALRKLAGREPLAPAGVLALAMLATFVAVNLAGLVQGENARILAYYAPFLLLSGLAAVNPTGHNARGLFLPALVGAQALTLLVMAAVLPVVPQDLNDPPDGPRADVPVLDVGEPRPVDAVFVAEGDLLGRLRLQSYRFVADLGAQVITLETVWAGDITTERPYQFEIIATGENRRDGVVTSAPHRWYAQNGNYLPTCWQTGDTTRDVTQVPLPPVSEPLVWTLNLRLVDPRTGAVMRLAETGADSLALGPVPYP